MGGNRIMETLSDRIPKLRPEFVEIEGVKEFIRLLKERLGEVLDKRFTWRELVCPEIDKLAGDKLI